MGRGYTESEVSDEMSEEMDEEYEKEKLEEMGIPEVEWAEDMERIEDLEIRQEEIKAAEEIVEKERALNERRESGETTGEDYLSERNIYLRGKKREATTRSFLKSRGRNVGNHLGRVFEGWDDIKEGSQAMVRKKTDLWQVKNQLGEEGFEELLNRTVDGYELREEIDEEVLEQVKSGKKE